MPVSSVKTIRNILDTPEEVEGEWFTRATKGWLFDHWDNQNSKNNGFASQVVTENSTSVGTIKKRYLAQQGDNPVLAHPTEEGKYRFFTLKEIMRLSGLPETYFLGEAKTVAGEICGQGAVVSTIRELISVNYGMCVGVPAPVAAPQEVVIESAGQMDHQWRRH